MSPGKRANVAGYDFLFKELIKSDGPNYQSRKGIFEVSYNDRDQGVLIPEKRSYFSGRDIMTEAGIRTNILKDIYQKVLLESTIEKILKLIWTQLMILKFF